MQYINRYTSPIGKITMASDGEALTGLWFDGQKYFALYLDKDNEEKDLPIFDMAKKWLDKTEGEFILDPDYYGII